MLLIMVVFIIKSFVSDNFFRRVAILGVIVCGFINGYFIAKVKANFIIVTLATQILFAATALIISEGRNLTSRPQPIYSYIGSANIFGFPVIIIFLIFEYVTCFTEYMT